MIKSRRRILGRVLALLLLGFIALSVFISFFPISIVDREFSEEVQEHQNLLLDTVMKSISWFGIMPFSLIMVLVVAFIFYLSKFKREAIFILITLSSGLLSALLKIIINRPRPTQDLVRIVEKAKYQSFPSGHVLFYVVFFGFIVLLMYHIKSMEYWFRWAVTYFCLFLIFTIPFSRVYLGAHWFTDVLGGFMIGLIWLGLISYFYLKNPVTPGEE